MCHKLEVVRKNCIFIYLGPVVLSPMNKPIELTPGGLASTNHVLNPFSPNYMYTVYVYTTYDILLNSPKLSPQFPCKQVGRILFFILDSFLCLIIIFILITKQLILCG